MFLWFYASFFALLSSDCSIKHFVKAFGQRFIIIIVVVVVFIVIVIVVTVHLFLLFPKQSLFQAAASVPTIWNVDPFFSPWPHYFCQAQFANRALPRSWRWRWSRRPLAVMVGAPERAKTVPKEWEAGIPQSQPVWLRDLPTKHSAFSAGKVLFEIQLQLCWGKKEDETRNGRGECVYVGGWVHVGVCGVC